MASVSSEFQALGQSLQNLRTIKGHWDGGDSNPSVDNFNGEKHQTLQKLGEYFGKPGTPAANILQTMGQPDEIKQTMDEAFHASLMPGHLVGGGAGGQSNALATGAGLDDVSTTMMPTGTTDAGVMYFIYKWRNNHDYLWFKVDALKEEVIESSWYHAYE
ncbi:hypothetical protein EC957_007197 [Mortierella hygrophila]|uniref:Uncharacterized protein n=1 Tax=Mortierella hygrophila TaxID=979708 RepID=A0A9P6JY80_9FUNG|nr:hypothetical protein EC957_007197 [Mortierella hygrophila]